MTGLIFLYISSALPLIWGIAHLFPTKNVVKGFGDISGDNKHIITMEWIIEGVSLIFIGILLLCISIIDHTNVISRAIYWLSFGMLNALSVISFYTGFKVKFFAFKLCPFIFTGSSIFIFLGIYI